MIRATGGRNLRELLCVLCTAVVFGMSVGCASAAVPGDSTLGTRPEPKLLRSVWIREPIQVSGMLYDGRGNFTIVSDDASDPLFSVAVPRNGFGFTVGRTTARPWPVGREALFADYERDYPYLAQDNLWDLEGIAQCGNTYYLLNERVREAVRFRMSDGTYSRLRPRIEDPALIAALRAGGPNAGFEGIAIDCTRGIAVFAKEREPKHLYRVELATGRLLGEADYAGANVPPAPPGFEAFVMNPDISDLALDHGFLYVLERNAGTIAKLDPETFRVVDRMRFRGIRVLGDRTLWDLFDTHEPYGQAEALVLTPTSIWLGLDSNRHDIFPEVRSELVKRMALDVADRPSVMVEIERPAGF